jgi:hypothetical protein
MTWPRDGQSTEEKMEEEEESLHVEGASHSEVIRREEVHHDRPHQGF